MMQVQQVDLRHVERKLVENLSISRCVIIEKIDSTGVATFYGFIVMEDLMMLDESQLEDLLPSWIHNFEIIPVSSMPYTMAGEIDRDKLASLEAADLNKITWYETRLRDVDGVREATVVFREQTESIQHVHLDDLFPSRKRMTQEAVARSSATVPEEATKGSKPLSVAYGGDLELEHGLPTTLLEALKRSCQESANKGILYVLDDGTEIMQTYLELVKDAERILAGLRKIGLKAQDQAILQLKNNQDLIPAFWACILGGIIPTPIGVAPTYNELNSVVSKLQHSWELLGRPVLITDETLRPAIEGLELLWQKDGLRTLTIEELRDNEPDTNWHPVQPEDLVLNLLTSGSTGMPKCIQHRHRSILARIKATSNFNGFSRDDVSLNWMPLDHVGGIVMFHVRDVYLGCQHISPRTDSFLADPLVWLDWVHKYRVTQSWAPNFAFALMNEKEEEIRKGHWDLSSLRYIMSAAEAVVANVSHRFLKIMEQHELPATAMVPCYGMSETSSAITQNKLFHRDDKTAGVLILDKTTLSSTLESVDLNHPNKIIFTEVGVPLPSVWIRIVDQNNNPMSEDRIGRLQAKGPTIMNGYYNNPEANAEVFVGDGWFNTGDLAFLHNGCLVITGREKDVIIINGANYLNYEIEAVVEELPGVDVTFSAAYGLFNPEEGSDQLAIFFVPNQMEADFYLPLIREVRQAITRKIGIEPRYIIPIDKDQFPKTNSGKIQRAQLGKSLEMGEFADRMKQIDLFLENENTLPQWFYQKNWRRQELGIQQDKIAADVLLFMDDCGLGEVLAKSFQEEGQTCIRVYLRDKFQDRGNGDYEIDPKSKEDYECLVKALIEVGIDVRHVLHLWNYGEGGVPQTLQDLQTDKEIGVLSLLYLVQSFAEAMLPSIRLTVVTNRGQAVLDTDSLDYQKSMLTGLLKTIPDEWVSCKVSHLDLSLGDNANVEHVCCEMSVIKNDDEVAYRNGERYVPYLQQVDAAQGRENSLSLAEGDRVLITGGLGGIGVELADFLLKQFQAKLLILGRTEIDTENLQCEKAAKLRSLQQLGDVQYQVADVSDLAQVRAAIKLIEGKWQQSLSIVFHLAGVGKVAEHWENSEDYSVLTETGEDFLAEMQAKVDGAQVLVEVLQDNPHTTLVLYGSVNGFFGGSSFGAYSAANSFLEGLALYMKREEKRQVVCLSWSLWDNLGMSLNNPMIAPAVSRGFRVLSKERGLYSLLVGLQLGLPSIYVGLDGSNRHTRKFLNWKPLPWRGVAFYTADEGAPPEQDVLQASFGAEEAIHSWNYVRLEEMPSRKNLAHLSDDKAEGKVILEPTSDLEKGLASIWSEILRVEQPDLGANFFELGGHSLKATQVIMRINRKFQVNAPIGLLFENHTLGALSAAIEELLQS